MAHLDVESLELEERAFVESISGLHQRIEALKVAFPEGRFHTALETMQAVNACLVAAAMKSGT